MEHNKPLVNKTELPYVLDALYTDLVLLDSEWAIDNV